MFDLLNLVSLRLTLNEVDASLLGKSVIRDLSLAYKESKKIAREFMVLHKCNCVELYFVLDKPISEATISSLITFWVEHSISLDSFVIKKIVIDVNKNACRHLFRVAASIESALIGDAQVLGQVKHARDQAIRHKTLGVKLDLVLKHAITAGNKTKRETALNKGNVSIGRAAVECVTREYPRIGGEIIVVGAGKMGKLIVKLLSEKINSKFISITNRTNSKALELSDRYNVNLVQFENFADTFDKYSVVIFATSAAQPLFKIEFFKNCASSNVMILDIGNPPNVPIELMELRNFQLISMTQVKNISSRNLQLRKKEVLKVSKIILRQLTALEKDLYILPINKLLSTIYKKAKQKKLSLTDNCILEIEDELIKKEVLRISDALCVRLLAPIGCLRQLAKTGKLSEATIIADYFNKMYR